MAIGEMETAIAVNPNFARGHYNLGFAYDYGAAQSEQALPHYDTALRLNPRDPLRWQALFMKGAALRFLGRYDEAITHCRQACQFPDSGLLPHLNLAAALAEAGQIGKAQAEVTKCLQLEPSLSIGFVRSNFVGMHETYSKSFFESMRKAGFPE